jgi:DNA-binding XRE family transcriptional regulator
MKIRTPADLGTLIRNTRKKLRLDQSTLAKTIGVSRLWLVEIEEGKPRAERPFVSCLARKL